VQYRNISGELAFPLEHASSFDPDSSLSILILFNTKASKQAEMVQHTSPRLALAAIISMLAPRLASSTAQESTSVAISATTTPSPTVPDSTAPTSSTTGVGALPRVHLVQVGAGGFRFEPAQLDNVAVGDVVTFEFYPPDHSVARAAYGKEPCMPYEYTGKDKMGFWSGTQWVDTVRDVRYLSLQPSSSLRADIVTRLRIGT
jgi:plastocyanin